MVLPALFAVTKGLPQRFGPGGRAVERSLAQGRGNPCLVSYGVVEPSRASSCSPPSARPARPSAILLGDSHAAALSDAMTALARDQRVRFAQYEKSSCAPLLGATRAMPKYPYASDSRRELSRCRGSGGDFFGGLLLSSFPMPREEFVKAVLWDVGDPGEDVGEPGERINVVEPSRAEQAEHHRGALAAAV